MKMLINFLGLTYFYENHFISYLQSFSKLCCNDLNLKNDPIFYSFFVSVCNRQTVISLGGKFKLLSIFENCNLDLLGD